MLNILLKKDISILLKDLRIQILGIIILGLFILSSITFNIMYKKNQETFNSKVSEKYQINEQYQINMMRYISQGTLSYFQKPTQESIILNKTGYPNAIFSKVTAYMPYVISHTKHSKKNMYITWLFIIGVIQSFAALLFSYDSISREKKDGTLRLQIVSGISRVTIFISKYLSLLLLFSLSNIVGITVSMLIIFLLLGFVSSSLISGGVFLFIFSLPFLSFFILSGILISMSRNYRTNIVVALAFWLIFVFIIPNLSFIIGENIHKLQSGVDFEKEWMNEYWVTQKKWTDKYDKDGVNKVGGNSYLAEGYRTAAVYEMNQGRGKIYKKRMLNAAKQIDTINKLSFISPYSVLEISMENLLELGLNKFRNEMAQFEEHQNNIEQKLKMYDNKDETSMHLFYSWAYGDQGVVSGKSITPFTIKPYPEPNELVLTNYKKDSLGVRIHRTLIPIIMLFSLSLLMLTICVLRIIKLDVR